METIDFNINTKSNLYSITVCSIECPVIIESFKFFDSLDSEHWGQFQI